MGMRVRLPPGAFNHSEISRKLGIPRTTVRDICTKYADVSQLAEEAVSKAVQWRFESSHRHHYAYLLGMYLGDGCISRHKRCYRLRITLDQKYPEIIQETKNAIEHILPNKVGIVQRKGCVDVSCYSKLWTEIFPQHGKGKKHQRKIVLKPWQRKIVKKFPQLFLKGLIHSDGCRDRNSVGGKEYPRYTFVNYSQDIMRIFKQTCRQLRLLYTSNKYKTGCMIANRKDVGYLDSFIGAKK